MDEPQPIPIELTGDQLTWLQWMRDKYHLGTSGYALCLLLDYCSQVQDVDERFIFTVIRCKRCGVRFAKQKVMAKLGPDGETIHQRIQLSSSRLAYMSRMCGLYEIPSIGKCARIMLDWAQVGRTNRRQTDEDKKQMLLQMEYQIFVLPFVGISDHDHSIVEEDIIQLLHLESTDIQTVLIPIQTRMHWHSHLLLQDNNSQS